VTSPLISNTGQVLSRAVTFQFALDPSGEQRVLFAKCAGARRFTFNHHLARVKSNLDARSSERDSVSEGEIRSDAPIPSISWSGFSFINEFNAWKNGKAEDSPINEDGSQGLTWRHELPSDVFERASVDAARELRSVSARRAKWLSRRLPPFSSQREGDAELPTEEPPDLSPGTLKPLDPVHRSLAPRTPTDSRLSNRTVSKHH
jgi:hypothetical protein